MEYGTLRNGDQDLTRAPVFVEVQHRRGDFGGKIPTLLVVTGDAAGKAAGIPVRAHLHMPLADERLDILYALGRSSLNHELHVAIVDPGSHVEVDYLVVILVGD